MSDLLARPGWPSGQPAGTATDRPVLLKGKLAAPVPATRQVDRVRLRRLLDGWQQRRVTMVSAPAGYGKTSLVASWVTGEPGAGPPAWVSLDRGDRDPLRFWSYALAALRSSGALPRPRPTGSGPLRQRDVLAALESLRHPTVLVLDDADAVAGSPAARSLLLGLRYRNPLHLVLCSRIQPPIPVGRLLVNDDLAVIDRADLAFTTAEIVELAALHGLALTRGQADELGRRSEGWVTGLTLALRGQHDRDPGKVAAHLVGDASPIADYLRDEVLAGQPAGTRDWLLRTSLLHRIGAQSADALTGRADGLPMLQQLHGENTFLTDEAETGALRYHRLFRELLLHEAAVQLPSELPDLHRSAAEWLATHGDPVGAVEHAAAVPDWGFAAELTVRYAAPHLYSAAGDRLRLVLSELARTLPRSATPEIAAAIALADADQGGPDTVPAQGPDGPVPATLRLAGAISAYQRGDHLQLLAAGDRPPQARPDASWDAAAFADLAQYHRAVGQLWCGHLDDARRGLDAACAGTDRAGLHAAQAQARSHRALLLALLGRLEEAEQAGVAASRYAHSVGVPPGSGTLLALWLVRWLRGSPGNDDGYLAGCRAAHPADPAPLAVALVQARTGAASTVDSARTVTQARQHLGDRPVPPLLRGWLAAHDADLLCRAGDTAAALRTVADLVEARASVGTAPAHLAAARAHLAAGAYRQAQKVLAAVRAGESDVDTGVRGWLLEAIAADALGHEGAVRIALAGALGAAAGQRLLRPFRDSGDAVQALLGRHHDLVEAQQRLAGRLDPATTPAAAPPRTGGASAAEPVTEREGVVLRYLPTMLTTDDIAAELCVSRNTVKSQIRSIYRKLGVARRRDAVHRARALHLI